MTDLLRITHGAVQRSRFPHHSLDPNSGPALTFVVVVAGAVVAVSITRRHRRDNLFHVRSQFLHTGKGKDARRRRGARSRAFLLRKQLKRAFFAVVLALRKSFERGHLQQSLLRDSAIGFLEMKQ